MQDSLNICWELEATRAAGQAEGLWIPSSVYTHSHRHTHTDTHTHKHTHTEGIISGRTPKTLAIAVASRE